VQPGARTQAARSYKPLLRPGLHKLIGFAQRWQGLIVAPGNPRNIRGVADLARPELRFANRAQGAGTRVLLDDLLAQAGLHSNQIRGYEREEPSHAAIAQAVASGSAEVGLGLQAAAEQAALSFVPLVQERYHLVCLKTALAEPAVQALITSLGDSEWTQLLARIPGYTPEHSGLVQSLKTMLPWWNLKPRNNNSKI
jgi:putative molybdopterin biosynthesis protein